MASTLSNATLTVKISESIKLNGIEQGGINTVTMTGINDIFKRIITCPVTETVLYTCHASNVAGSTFDVDNIKYARITNKDDSNSVDLIIEATDEIGFKLGAGRSLILFGHTSLLEGIAGNVTVTNEVAATSTITITDGDAANGMSENESLTLISTDGTTKKYVIVDDVTTTVATGDILTATSDVGGTTAGTANAGGIAVAINTTGGSQTTQNGFLLQLKAAIEHANGHNGKITISTSETDSNGDGVPDEANGNQTITLTQATSGEGGNTSITENIANFAATNFASGAYAFVAGKTNIVSINAIANTAAVDLEVFIASV